MVIEGLRRCAPQASKSKMETRNHPRIKCIRVTQNRPPQ
jgi:hypothetical protein